MEPDNDKKWSQGTPVLLVILIGLALLALLAFYDAISLTMPGYILDTGVN